MTNLERVRREVCSGPWPAWLVYADLLEAEGRDVEAAGWRWLAKNHKLPHLMDDCTARWYLCRARRPVLNADDIPTVQPGITGCWSDTFDSLGTALDFAVRHVGAWLETQEARP